MKALALAIALVIPSGAGFTAVQALGTAAELSACPCVAIEYRNERLDRTRLTVTTREGAVLTRRRVMPLSTERFNLQLRASTSLRFYAHDEGFNTYLDDDYVIDVHPGDSLRVTVTTMDMIAVLQTYRER